MIKIHKYSMPVMDATKYWGECDEGTTLRDLVSFIGTDYSAIPGEINVVGDRTIGPVEFKDGKPQTEIPEEYLCRKILSLKITEYYYRTHQMMFDVILED